MTVNVVAHCSSFDNIGHCSKPTGHVTFSVKFVLVKCLGIHIFHCTYTVSSLTRQITTGRSIKTKSVYEHRCILVNFAIISIVHETVTLYLFTSLRQVWT